MSDNMFRWEKDADNVVTLTMDDPGANANTLNDTFVNSLEATLDRLDAEKDDIAGVIVTSAKKTFFAGAELNLIIQATEADVPRLDAESARLKGLFRRLETLGKPVAAAVNGAALGGGLEIALACHYRVALDARGSEIGLPEVSLGLLPGAGGVVRTTRMFGLTKALMEVLLQGQRRKPAAAREVGLVDEVASTHEEMLAAAKKWVLEHPDAEQPWDAPGYKIPGGAPSNPKLAAMLPAFPANLRKQIKGAP
ncbi:MAG: enoyl-CoA hydratase-related protein, partial [Actinomycetota bacterium]